MTLRWIEFTTKVLQRLNEKENKSHDNVHALQYSSHQIRRILEQIQKSDAKSDKGRLYIQVFLIVVGLVDNWFEKVWVGSVLDLGLFTQARILRP